MRASAVKTMRGQRTRETSSKSSFHAVAHDCLSLPRVSRKLANPLKYGAQSDRLVRLALSMIKAGLIEDRDTGQNLSDIVCEGLEKWINSIWTDTKYMGFELVVKKDVFSLSDDAYSQNFERSDASSIDEGLRKAIESDCGLDPAIEHVALVFTSRGRTDLKIGCGVESLEAQQKGLGFEVVSAIEQLGHGYGLMGSGWIEHIARDTQWCGGESEQEWADQCGEELDSYEGLTRAEFDELVPKEWQRSKRMSTSALKKLKTSSAVEVQKVATLLLDLRKLGQKARGFFLDSLSSYYEWERSFDSSILLGWKDFECIYRMADDYTNNLYENSYIEAPGIGIELLPVDDPEWFGRKKKEWVCKSNGLKIIDELLCLIVEKRIDNNA